MALVRIRIHGRDYDIACDDGQEAHLRYLSDEVDMRMRSLVDSMKGYPGEVMAMLLTNLMMADELVEKNKEIKRLKADSGAHRMLELENAVASTLDTIAARMETIAEGIEVR